MATIQEEAKAYQPKRTKNIADIDKISIDLQLEDDEFEVDKNGEIKVIKQKITIINGESYRVPNSVLKQLKVQIEENPELKFFKVRKVGEGLDTEYTVIPLL